MEDGVKISELTTTTTISDSDLIPIVQSNETKSISALNFKNSINNYSTNEIEIGKWIDNKTIYKRTINFGTLPNNSQKSIAHNISNIERIVDYQGIADNGTTFRTLPATSPLNLEYNIDLYIDTTNISILTGTDRTGYTAYITIKYTKTTD